MVGWSIVYLARSRVAWEESQGRIMQIKVFSVHILGSCIDSEFTGVGRFVTAVGGASSLGKGQASLY